MADNFNLRAFLTENKLTKNAQLLKEEATNEARYSDSYDSPASKEVHAQLSRISLKDLDAAIAKAEEETGTKVSDLERSVLQRQKNWMNTMDMEMERESVDNKKPVMETKLTAREKKLVAIVENALGIEKEGYHDSDDLENNVSNDAAYEKAFDTMDESEMVQENPLPKYKNIDELMSNIEHGTNEAAHKYKMERMKEVAEALEAKVTSLEEGENAEHIDQKAVKQMRKDILALRKAEEKLRKEFEKKFASKKEKKEDK